MSKGRAGLAEGAFGLWIFACAVFLELVVTETIPLYWWIVAFFFGPFAALAILFLVIICFGGRTSG